MNRSPALCLSLMLPLSVGACATTTHPVVVETPGMPSAELALQRSLDRVHDFLSDLDGRIGAPAKQVAAAPWVPRADLPSLAPGHPIRLTPVGTSDATATTGFDGTVYFAFAGGTPRVRCRPGSVCMLRLARGEQVTPADLRLDDPSSWSVRLASAPRARDRETVLAIMPSAGASATVLHVHSNLRGYHVALEPTDDASMLLVSFTYRPDDPAEQGDPDAVQRPTTTGQGVTTRLASAHYGNPDFNYRLLGASPPWRPVRVYCDGGRTYVQFPTGGIAAAPRLLVSTGAGSLTPITYRVEADSYVVDRILDDALLVAGTGPQQQTVLLRHNKAS